MAHPDPVFVTADVPHAEFSRGLPFGHYRVVVNPEKAQKYVQARLLIKLIALPVLGIGAAVALAGYPIPGVILVVLGFVVPRIIKHKASELLLHLAMRDPKIYREAVDYEILEVRAPWRGDDSPGNDA